MLSSFLLLSLLTYPNIEVEYDDFHAYEVAEVSILDKITTEVISTSVPVNQESFFANVRLNLLGCWSFCDYGEEEYLALLKITNNNKKVIFNGWLFSKYPSFNNFEHPIFDIMLRSCR